MSLRQAGKYCIFSILFICCLTGPVIAQRVIVKGTVTNSFTKERIPFASVSWKRSGHGVVSDSAGNFTIPAQRRQIDTLLVSSVGFNTQILPLALHKDTTQVNVFLEDTRDVGEVVVRSKYNRGLLWWKKIVANKALNNPYRQQSYSYELYNKLEVDIDNISRRKFEQYKILKPFGFILDNIDSISEDKPFLPVFITESISDCYFATHPFREREEIKAIKTNGVKNESVIQYMGGLNQRINTYDNYMTLFGKEFISPLSSVG
ncbi:MAG TPA: carboxypeptidase-like regulatory domain-containing protein, partial [Puia sp.]